MNTDQPRKRSAMVLPVKELAAAAVVLALIIALVIVSCSRAGLSKEYEAARNEFGFDLYSNISAMISKYDEASLIGADLQENIIPSMKQSYILARSIDDSIAEAFGAQYLVLNESIRGSLDSAFEKFDTAFSTGMATDDAQASMSSCISTLRELLSTRFNDDGTLLAL